MQQTEKYQFNLIEPSDTFSPDSLNENMEKVEAQFDAARAEAAAGDAALDQRLQVFEAKHFVMDYFTGTKDLSQDILLGFTPKVVIAMLAGETVGGIAFVMTGTQVKSTYGDHLEIIDGGFRAGNTLNYVDKRFCYLAID